MDEYERAARELETVLGMVTPTEYEAFADTTTQHRELRTIGGVMDHVLNSGYGYATYIGAAIGKPLERPKVADVSHGDAVAQLHAVLAFTNDLLRPNYEMHEDEMDKIKIYTPWKVEYTVDQMLEHAVCHVLRHRRQIEKFLAILRGNVEYVG
jgi:uncharacterized damage-inducible protein DinB